MVTAQITDAAALECYVTGSNFSRPGAIEQPQTIWRGFLMIFTFQIDAANAIDIAVSLSSSLSFLSERRP